MKATINGTTVEGSPQEINEFIKLQEYKPFQKQLIPRIPSSYPWNQKQPWDQTGWNPNPMDLGKITCWN